jgi:hypothetical protein
MRRDAGRVQCSVPASGGPNTRLVETTLRVSMLQAVFDEAIEISFRVDDRTAKPGEARPFSG